MLSTKHVFLIGFMGSGKTTIGKMLSTATNLPFVDFDVAIEKEQGKTVTQLFNEIGEEKFRELERKALLNCAKEKPSIVSTGGGVPCFYDNMEVMRQMGVSIYLKASPHELAARLVGTAPTRPLLKGIDSAGMTAHIESMLSKREPFYLMAEHVVETDGQSDNAVLASCLSLLHIKSTLICPDCGIE